MKVALVYDRVNKWGGAERVLLLLKELFPHALLYTSVYNPASASWANVFTVKTSFLQYIPGAKSAHEFFPMLMPLAFESFSFDEYDLVISVTSEAGKGILTKPKTIHICYCLTPTRYLWSGYHDYFQNKLFRLLAYPIIWYLRTWDSIAANRPDAYVAISQEVQRRIKQYYHQSSEIIYPPLTLVGQEREQNTEKTKGYFLVVSRLIPYKRIDIAIDVCTKLGLPLKIIGTGSHENALKNRAGDTVEFLGNLTDKELLGYYKGCKALLVPGKEDFGLTALEAQAMGRPVIAYREGGVCETVIKDKTGEFFFPQTAQALEQTMLHFMDQKYDPEVCKKQAAKFTKEEFKKNFMNLINKIVKEQGEKV